MTLVYRVVRQKYADRPLDTTGTRLNGGRWNPPGIGILYTAEHPALALVEIMVHMPQIPYDQLPAYRLFTLDIPTNSQRLVQLSDLPPDWNAPNYTQSQRILTNWLTQPDVLALGVPSSVLPTGTNYLLHPAHADYQRIQILDEQPLVIDPRLWPG